MGMKSRSLRIRASYVRKTLHTVVVCLTSSKIQMGLPSSRILRPRNLLANAGGHQGACHGPIEPRGRAL